MGVKAACELFLDSLIYNAHGTAADALWTRVPLVTAPGALQPARVAASMLLHPARALTQLVARTPAEMRALAVSFAVSRAAPKGEQAGLAWRRRSKSGPESSSCLLAEWKQRNRRESLACGSGRENGNGDCAWPRLTSRQGAI